MSRKHRSGRIAVRRRKARRGATMVETAMTLFIFLTLVLGMLDLGMGILRHQQLTEVARTLSRAAAVRGAFSDRLGIWGPTAMSGNAADASAIAAMIRQRMTSGQYSELAFNIDWIDAGNNTQNDDRVQVTLSVPYRPMMTFIFGSPTINLRTVSVTPIAH